MAVFLLACAAIIVLLWYSGVFLPGWISWQNDKQIKKDSLQITLADSKTTVFFYSNAYWESPSGVKVQDVLCMDIDHDGEEEMLLLCWKIGRYGDVAPRFGAGEEAKWFQHIYIYDLNDDSVHAIWMASEIGFDVRCWYPKGSSLVLEEPGGRATEWIWDDWGLELLGEVKK